ncbi:hypothetical protein E4T81_14705 [Barnesiella sp. WM24]|nr:hypothetical protein EEL36_07765 [Muribaculaceae bacterium Isolate-043 (Harlan)]ROT08799.1 hypothetical protein EEL33_04015 [Muribaculaceae bacterium Isolate-037 (Harlan)]TFU91747.1 hypothetical protein E4T81_14705 [Barnesiella sp. WM24]
MASSLGRVRFQVSYHHSKPRTTEYSASQIWNLRYSLAHSDCSTLSGL